MQPNLSPAISLTDQQGGALGEGAAVDFVGAGKRHLGEKPDAARVQVGGGIGERESLDCVFAWRSAGARHDEGGRLLVFQFVGDRYYRCLMNVGVALQQLFDFAG